MMKELKQFSFQNSKAKFKRKFGGVDGDEVPPDPIPNSEVKLVSGKNSAGETLCKSSTMPPFIFKVLRNERIEKMGRGRKHKERKMRQKKSQAQKKARLKRRAETVRKERAVSKA